VVLSPGVFGVELIEPPWARRLPHAMGEIISEERRDVHPRWLRGTVQHFC